MSELDRLLEAAAQAEPEELSLQQIDSEIGLAQITGRARHRAWVRRRLLLATGVGTALAAAAALIVMFGPGLEPEPPRASASRPAAAPAASPHRELARSPEPTGSTDVELPTGDRLLAGRGARFRVRSATEAERRIRLLSGEMLFDVRRSARGRFHVETGDARVTVVGTVFTVSAEPSGTIVRVYEGRVEVTHEGARELIEAGQTAAFPSGVGTLDEHAEDPLAEEARRAVARRRPEAAEARTRPAPSTPARGSARVGAEEVSGWITDGEAERALVVARARIASGDVDPWALIEADALRALGRRTAAARAYTRAAATLPTPRREQAGFTAARLHRSARDGLHALDVGDVSEPGSPLRERGLAMRADLLERLGRRAERAEIARIYLERYPDGSRAQSMRDALE